MSVLSGLTSAYLLVIFVRVILTWFRGVSYSRPVALLARVTDPYLAWFRRFPGLRQGAVDLSPVVALTVLSLANQIFATLARYGVITAGLVLAMIVEGLWSVASFLLGFGVLILVLRTIAYLANLDIYSPFWNVVDVLARPLLFRVSRILFGRRIVPYRTGLFVAIAVLGALVVAGSLLVPLAAGFLAGLPV